MKHFKHLLFLSILCSLVLFTNCGEDSEDGFILDKLNGYYFPTNESQSILEFQDNELFWSVLTDSCRYDIMNSLTLDTITNHTSSEYSGVYQVSGWDEGKNDVTPLLKAFPDIATFMRLTLFRPTYLKTEHFYLRLTVTDNGSGIDFIVENGKWVALAGGGPASLDSCFVGTFAAVDGSILPGDKGGCTTIDRSWSTQFISDNSQSMIDDFIQAQECN